MIYNNKYISLTDLILNAKFVDGGRGENYEYDCWGLCLEVFRRCEIELPDYSIIINDLSNLKNISSENKFDINSAINKYKPAFVKLSEPCVPCIVVIKYCLGNYYNHVGTYVDVNRFIHITTDRGCAIEHMDSPMWINKIEGFYFPLKYWSDKNANSSNS